MTPNSSGLENTIYYFSWFWGLTGLSWVVLVSSLPTAVVGWQPDSSHRGSAGLAVQEGHSHSWPPAGSSAGAVDWRAHARTHRTGWTSHRAAVGLQEEVSQAQVFQESCAEATQLLMT